MIVERRGEEFEVPSSDLKSGRRKGGKRSAEKTRKGREKRSN